MQGLDGFAFRTFCYRVRLDKNWTQTKMGDQIGVTLRAIQYLESGEHPPTGEHLMRFIMYSTPETLLAFQRDLQKEAKLRPPVHITDPALETATR
jgi:transcriptional regulator with XRE-family HTH domain